VDNPQQNIFGIDLGTTYSCIAYVDGYGQPVVVLNSEGENTTPSVVHFEGNSRVVGREAKNSALVNHEQVVEMVKRQMGVAHWRFEYNGIEYSAEEISSYILRKLADDTEQYVNIPVKDVVITCPAYFGITQREATARAGEIAGLNVREVINEPTAAAITYGLQNEQDQVVLVYDLGGGTFDITVIAIKSGTITVIATDGDHLLGGRDWDGAIVSYLAAQWQDATGSTEDPTDSPETLQDLWMLAEQAKKSLTGRYDTKVHVFHAGERVTVTLTRDKFDELTSHLLERTITFTASTMQAALARGIQSFDKILLVGGSTRMPQVMKRLEQEFHLPCRIFEPDEAVAKGAAIYAHKLLLDEKIQIKIAEMIGDPTGQEVPEEVMQHAQEEVARENGLRLPAVKRYSEMEVTNVASHSFGIVVIVDEYSEREAISNLVIANDALPIAKTKTYYTLKRNQQQVSLRVMENMMQDEQVGDLSLGEEIGKAVLPLPSNLPAETPIEVTFELNNQGRLRVVGKEPISGAMVEATIETKRGMSEDELYSAKARADKLLIS
jgi:molecular chaperone DnaK (HSP70)